MKSAIVLLVLCITGTLTLEATLQEFVAGNSKFAASVYKELLARNTTGNFLVSPFSAQVILALAQSGARNETGEEIRSSLSFAGGKEEIEEAVKFLLATIEDNPHYSLHAANKIYASKYYKIRNQFKTVAREIYRADLENLDFTQKKEAADEINRWVGKHTDNKIHDLMDAEMLNNKTRAVLVNALLFKGNWSSPFPTYLTIKKNFYQAGNQTVQVETMHDFDGGYNYAESAELQAKFLEMPFEGTNVSMTIVLPNDKDGLGALEEKIDQVLGTSTLTKENVNVALPKFKIESKIDCKEVLQSLGVSKAFRDGEADFSEIAGKPGELFISDVVQKSFIDVNEDGVEAAAATFIIKIINRFRDPPKDFTADHPFLFYIKVEGLVLFIGRVVTPSY
ncbi:Serpin domain containing protein [Asbolus verrucosus]|uniref:Serpin domain containing protein n=1 Tax=Asbolus verrucosus TaxID=1661398 RepID=A0A482VZG2_ASBVE|nr:Serpin domain containing protein [Asbolus verrucosus]